MDFWQRLDGWIGRSLPSRRSSDGRQGRRRRKSAEAQPAFFVRRLEDRRVLNADPATAQTLTIAENAAAGTTVGTVDAPPTFDPSQPLTYCIISGNPSNAFLVVPNSGEVQVQNPEAIDYEQGDRFELTIGVTREGETEPSATFDVIVQVTDVYAPATVQLTGGEATLSLVDGRLQVRQGTDVVWNAPAEDVSSLSILGSAEADTLIVDFAGGNPVPVGGLFYDGLDQPVGTMDAIDVRGTFDATGLRYDNAHDGGITLQQGSVERTIEYRNLEPVAVSGGGDVTITLTGSNDNVLLEELSPGTLRISSSTPTIETTTFLAPTSPTGKLIINGGAGIDTLTIRPLTGSFSLQVDVETLVVDQVDAALTNPTFEFGGFAFNQNDTPNQAVALGTGAISGGYGATISTSPGGAIGGFNFPELSTGFDSSLSIGRLIYPSNSSGTLGINMPAGDVGTLLRAGIELSWSGGRTLSNQAGDDFVIYESSSNPSGPDAAMVQVHITGGGWTKWRYETKDSRANYGAPGEGAFATAYDLADFGLTSGQTIDGIRYVNMTAADRMEGPGVEKIAGSGVYVATGFVLPGDNGATSNVLPDPGSSASFAYFGNSTFDPDPLYFGMLHPLTAPLTTGGIDQVTVGNTSIQITRDGTLRPTVNYTSVTSLSVNTYDAADQITVTLNSSGPALPASISLNGGNPSVADKVTVVGTSGNHTINLAGSTITSGGTTIALAGIEAATIDVSAGAAGSGDTVNVNRSFTLAGNSPSLQITGGGATQNDALSVDTEYAFANTSDTGTYTFASKSFDQSGTPNQLSELGIGTLLGGLGVVVTTRPGDSSALTSGFPGAPTSGYNPSLSLGALWDRTTATTTRILALPDSGNNGSSARGGFVVSWTGDRVLVDDGVGEDLVIYESGSTLAPEPMMVQVHNVDTNTWSSWVYKSPLASAATSGGVGFPTVYDLSTDFGMSGARIDAIRVVNMTAADRMADVSGEGVVLPGETNPTSTTLPKPGVNASFGSYGLSDLDPDPIYLGVRHALGGITARNDVVSVDFNSVDITGYNSIGYAGMKALSLTTGDGADTITVKPSAATTYAIDGGTPGIATNPGDRVVIDLAGVTSSLLEVTGIGAATLTSSHQNVTFAGIDSFGATAALDVKATAAANPTVGANTFILARNGASDELTVNGALAFRGDRSAIDNFEIQASTTSDALTINFAGGDPIPTGHVNYVGNATNTINYAGTGITTVTHQFDSSSAGKTTIDGSVVDYSGVTQINDDLTAANRNLVYVAAADNNIVLADDAAAGDNRSNATSNNSASLKFLSPTTTFTVDAGLLNDSITLQQLDSSFAAATTLRGQTGNDFILFDSNGATAGGTVDWIKFALTVDGGGQTDDRLTIEDSSSTRDKSYSVSNVQIGGGTIPAGAAVDTPDASPTVDGTVGSNEWDQVPYAFDTGPRPASNQQSILHFTFSEGAGSTTADTTGNANNGLLVTTVGPQFRPSDGKFGGALEFNGTTDYAWFQDASFDIGTKGSLSFWVNLDTVTRRNQFFEGPGNLGFEFQYRENSGGQFYGSPNRGITGNTDDFAISSGGASALVNTWVNLQYTWQKIGASTGEMRLYVNGAEVTYLAGSDANITSWATVANTTQAFVTMGRDASTTPGAGSSRYFDGKMDDVAFFDVVLNSTQRAAIYTAGPTPVVRSIDQIQAMVGHDAVFNAKGAGGNLIAYWNMDHAPGTAVAGGNGGTSLSLNLTAEGTQAGYLATGGKFGGGLDFTNPNSYATFQDATFDVGAEGSLSVWLNLRDGVRRGTLFEGADDSGFEFQYRENSSGQFYGTPNRGSGNSASGDPVIQLNNARNNVGAWHNVIYTWKRTTANSGELRIYIDNTEVSYLAANNQNVTGWANLVSTVNKLMIMGRDASAATPDRWLDGKVDDVAWFNQVLTPTQRAALQTNSVSAIQATIGHDQYFDAKATNAANGKLLAYWNFDAAPVAGVFAGNGGTPIALNLNVPAAAEGVAFDTVAGPTLPGTGAQINAGVFDGNADFVRVTDSSSLDFSKQQGTISLWVNPTFRAVDNTTAGFSNLVEDSNEQIELAISWQDNAGATFGNADMYRRIVFSPFENTAAGNQNIIVSNSRLAFNTWTHVTVTWDFTTRTAAIYINGQLDSTLLNNTSNPTKWTQAASNTGDWIFGADGKALSKFFTGKMADIAVFGTALRASEVLSTYQNGAGNTGGFDLAGAKGRFTWDSTTLYGLIEDFPAVGTANGPFSNLFVDLYYNGMLVTSLDASQPSNNVPGSVVVLGGAGARYEFSIPFSEISPTFDPAGGDSLTYKIRTIDADVPGAGFDTKETTLGWVVEPPLATDGYREMQFAASENFFGVGGRLTYTNFADLTINAGNGADAIRVVDSQLPTPTTNPTRLFKLNTGGGNDDVTIESIDSAFRAEIEIDGQGGTDDHVQIDAALTLGSAASTGKLTVTAERIDVTQAIDTTAGSIGDVTFKASTKLTMNDDADVTAKGNFLAEGDAVETAAEIETTVSAKTITFKAATKLTGDVTLTTNDGNVRFQDTTVSATVVGSAGTEKLTIDAGDGDVKFDAAVGTGTPIGKLEVDAKNLTVSSSLAVAADGIDVDVSDAADFEGTITTTLNGTMTVTNDGLLTLKDNASLAGAFLQDGDGDVHLYGDITTTTDKVTFEGPVTLQDDVTITTVGGDVEFDGAAAVIDGTKLLTIAADATGNVTFDAVIGGITKVDGVKITSSLAIVANETIKTDDQGLDFTSTGATTFKKAVTTESGGAVKVNNSGLLTIDDAADFDLTGEFHQTGTGGTSLAGDIKTTDDKVTFNAGVVLTKKIVIDTGATGGDIKFGSTLDATTAGAQDLQLDAAAANIRFVGVVGGSKALGSVQIDAAADLNVDSAFTATKLTHLNGTDVTTFDGLTTLNTAAGSTALELKTPTVVVNAAVKSIGGDFNVTTDDVTINPATGALDVSSAGIITIVQQTDARTIRLGGDTATSLSLSDAELDKITAGVLRIGNAASGSIDVFGDIDPAATPILHLTTGGNVAGNGKIVNERLAVDAAGEVQLTQANDVDRLAVGVSSTTGRASFVDVDDVLLTDVDGIRGLTTVNGNATLQADGAVTQDATANLSKIAVNGLELLGAGPFILTNATNVINTLAASLTGSLTLRDAVDLKIGTVQTFGAATAGVTTTDDDVTLRSTGSVNLETSIGVGNASVRLTADNGAIVESGAAAIKVTGTNLGLSAATGIGVGRPLLIDVGQLAAQNFISGNVAIVEQSGALLTIGTAAGVTGMANLGGGGISVQHVGPMTVAAPIVDAGGGVSFITTTNGGNDDHLSIAASILVLGGGGDVNLVGGTDLLVHDTGEASDIWVMGSGSLFGSASRDVVLDSNVIVRSATGAIENIPPYLQNLSGPQVTNLGEAFVTYDFGRALELNFTALIDWSDGTIDLYSFLNPNTTTAAHVYLGNPNTIDQSAPILVTVTLQSDSRIHFAGYEFTTLTTLLEFPGDGVRHVRIDTTAYVPQISIQPPPKFVAIQEVPQTQIIRAIIDTEGGSSEETVETATRIVVLREILPDGREGSEVQFEVGVLDDLAALFKKVRNGKYKVILVEPETKSERTVIEINVQGGKPTSAEAGSQSTGDRPDGAEFRPLDDVNEALASASMEESNEAAPLDETAELNELESQTGTAAVPPWAPAVAGAALVASSGNWQSRAQRALSNYKKSSRLFTRYRPRRRSR